MHVRIRPRVMGNLLLGLTALIWGCAFVAQRAGMEHVGPFAFNGLRSLLASVALGGVYWGMRAVRTGQRERRGPREKTGGARELLLAAGLCGLCLFVAASAQQIGLVDASAGHGGFITALYILIVPLLSLFAGRRVRWLHWFCAGLGVAGLWLLCAMDGLSGVGRGDWWLLGCAFAFSFHILVVAHFAPQVDAVALSALQFLVAGVLSLPLIPVEARLFGTPAFSWEALGRAWVPFVYAGLGSSAIGYTFQIVGQRYTDPTVASLLMCLESVFAVLMGVLFGERLTGHELAGCGLLFVAILLAQVPEKPDRKRPGTERGRAGTAGTA